MICSRSRRLDDLEAMRSSRRNPYRRTTYNTKAVTAKAAIQVPAAASDAHDLLQRVVETGGVVDHLHGLSGVEYHGPQVAEHGTAGEEGSEILGGHIQLRLPLAGHLRYLCGHLRDLRDIHASALNRIFHAAHMAGSTRGDRVGQTETVGPAGIMHRGFQTLHCGQKLLRPTAERGGCALSALCEEVPYPFAPADLLDQPDHGFSVPP